jgi:hypothetical protein
MKSGMRLAAVPMIIAKLLTISLVHTIRRTGSQATSHHFDQ